jgi:hypothetical protein
LYSLTQKKCPYLNCKHESKTVKKEGANKIFLIDRDIGEDEEQALKRERKKSRDSFSKGESTAHPTQQEREHKRTRQKYLTPKDIYNEMRKVWQN